MRLHALDDPGEFLAILRLDLRPQDILRSFAEEGPVLLLIVGQLGLDFDVIVLDLGRQEVAVLKSDFRDNQFNGIAVSEISDDIRSSSDIYGCGRAQLALAGRMHDRRYESDPGRHSRRHSRTRLPAQPLTAVHAWVQAA